MHTHTYLVTSLPAYITYLLTLAACLHIYLTFVHILQEKGETHMEFQYISLNINLTIHLLNSHFVK